MESLAHGLAAGLLFAVAFPPLSFWPASFLIAWPVTRLALRVAHGKQRLSPASAGFWGAIGIAPWWTLSHVWVGSVSSAGLLPLVILLSSYTMLFVWLAARIARRFPRVPMALLAPVAWVAVELLRGSIAFDGYAWYLVAHPLIDAPLALASPATVLGTYFVSALAVALAGLLAGMEHARDGRKAALVTAGGLAVWPIAGFAIGRAVPSSEDAVRVAVVQSNVDRSARDDWTFLRRTIYFNHQLAMTLAATRNDPVPDVLVWPESSVPGSTLDPVSLATEREADLFWPLMSEDPADQAALARLPDAIGATELSDRLLEAQRILRTPLIVGGTSFDNFHFDRDEVGPLPDYDAVYNTTFVIAGGAVVQPWYDKHRLTPFGEVMPYISSVPALERLLLDFGARGMSFVLAPSDGPKQVTIPLADGREIAAAAPICFEATDPGVCRSLVYSGSGERLARVMFNLTDDGWFTFWNAGRRQHEMTARWRCVELATPMVRAANTGISGGFDARGRPLPATFSAFDDELASPGDRPTNAGAPPAIAGVLTVDVPLARGTTLYARIGDTFAWVCLILTLGLAFLSVVTKPNPIPESDGASSTTQ